MARICLTACLTLLVSALLLGDDRDSDRARSSKENRLPDATAEPAEADAEVEEHAHEADHAAHEHDHEAEHYHGESPFGGEIVGITLKSDPSFGIYLSNAELRHLGSREFLVGRGADSGTVDWTVGRLSWVALDDIAEIVEFESEDELQEILSEDPDSLDPDA